MDLSIRADFADVQRRLDGLQQDIARRALPSAINKTAAIAKTAMSREIRSAFAVTPAQVNDSLRITKAKFTKSTLLMEASLESANKRGRSLNLVHFLEKTVSLAAARKRMAAGEGGAYQLKGRTVQKQLELRFKVRKDGPKKTVKGAFLANKGRTVFIREGKERLPIKAVQTIAISGMFNTKRVNAKVVAVIRENLPRIFAHEVEFFTAKFNQERK